MIKLLICKRQELGKLQLSSLRRTFLRCVVYKGDILLKTALNKKRTTTMAKGWEINQYEDKLEDT